jgi:hypothetical protein
MPTYSADQIIDKVLIAKKPVPVYDLPPYDKLAKQIAVVQPSQTVGTVYSYVGGTPGKFLCWQFYDKNNKAYYAAHVSGYYDVQSLKDQGALTTKEETKLKADENKSTLEKFLEDLSGGAKNVGKYILIGGAALIALNIILKNRNK